MEWDILICISLHLSRIAEMIPDYNYSIVESTYRYVMYARDQGACAHALPTQFRRTEYWRNTLALYPTMGLEITTECT